MRVFVSVGHRKFDRLLRAVDDALSALDCEITGLAQTGPSGHRLSLLENVDYLSREDFKSQIRQEDDWLQEETRKEKIGCQS